MEGPDMKIDRSQNIRKSPVEAGGAEGVGVRWLIGEQDGAENFAMRMFELEVGGYTPLHSHPHEHEVFVLEGEGVVTDEGRERPIGPEDVVFVPGDTEHNFRNTGDSTLRFLCLVPMSAV